ncbi:NAD(P)/FAD-dependent oxidoreductase [Cytophagaceae bacterium ABcell3]|nr:NAD(P)/FAD-dependent oxidoreductase [Cytophagaceae bacterium ABcell3]
MSKKTRVAVIGGGAAGFFGAVTCAHLNPYHEISIFEKSNKLLSKVLVSGGGRCNVTNACFDNKQLVKNYPRGEKFLRKVFATFSVKDTVNWFENRNVALKTEPDNRIFPKSDSSATITDCLISEARVNGVKIYTGFGVSAIKPHGDEFQLVLRGGEQLVFDKIVISTGGNPNPASWHWIKELGHNIKHPVPSLFTFNIPNSRLNGLQGISVPEAKVKIDGTQMHATGPLLITHWGFSGPAVLKLSAFAARTLSDKNYDFYISINWTPSYSEEELRTLFIDFREKHPKKQVYLHSPVNLPRRLWERITSINGIGPDLKWGDINNKSINKTIEELLRGRFHVKGKTTFKEEFVTCGGVDLNEINPNTMESLKCPGIYFAGEVMDIDGITGGFNFQAAWSTGYIAGKSIAGI